MWSGKYPVVENIYYVFFLLSSCASYAFDKFLLYILYSLVTYAIDLECVYM